MSKDQLNQYKNLELVETDDKTLEKIVDFTIEQPYYLSKQKSRPMSAIDTATRKLKNKTAAEQGTLDNRGDEYQSHPTFGTIETLNKQEKIL